MEDTEKGLPRVVRLLRGKGEQNGIYASKCCGSVSCQEAGGQRAEQSSHTERQRHT